MSIDRARNHSRPRRRILAGAVALCRKLSRNEGQALLEFALLSPLALLLVLGGIVFGVGLNDYLVLNNATALGAQQLAISRKEATDPCAAVYTAVTNAAPNLTAANLTFTISVGGTKYVNGVKGSANVTCSGTTDLTAYDNNEQGQNVSVTVTYPFTASFIGFSSQSYTMSATVGGVLQ